MTTAHRRRVAATGKVRSAAAAAREMGTAASSTATVSFTGVGNERRSSGDGHRGQRPDPKSCMFHCHHGFSPRRWAAFYAPRPRGNLG
jgi:hypothetical protein